MSFAYIGADGTNYKEANFKYWLVSKEVEKKDYVLTEPVALVRCGEFTANALCGDWKIAADWKLDKRGNFHWRNKGEFLNGKPKKDSDYIFELIEGIYPAHGFISSMTDEIGPLVWDKREKDAAESLRKSRNRARGQEIGRRLTDADKREMLSMRNRGVSLQYIADKFGIGRSSVSRHIARLVAKDES